MLAARDKAENDKESLAALDRRLATAQKVAKLPELNQAIVAATQAVPASEAALAAAQKLLDEYRSAGRRRKKQLPKRLAMPRLQLQKPSKLLGPSTPSELRRRPLWWRPFKAADAARQKLPDNAASLVRSRRPSYKKP